jgi:hypothetical protein
VATLPALRSGTHVAFDVATGESLVELGATNLVRASANFTMGPSRRNIPEHIRVREAWYGHPDTWDHLYSTEVRWEAPVVLWVSPGIADRLNLWRTCNWLRDRGIPRRDVLVVEVGPAPRGPRAVPRSGQFDWHHSVSDHSGTALLEHLPAARPWPRERYDRAVKLWEQYVDADPRRFVRSCLGGVRGFPELGRVWGLISRFFPRMSAGRTLRLSRFDELLLSALSMEWKTPVKVFVADLGEEWEELVSCTGDLGMAERLAYWARHDAGSAVERAPGPRPAETHGPMTSSVYRLTERGMQLRAALPRLVDAPRLPVAGTEAYAPGAPWVVLDDGKLARL